MALEDVLPYLYFLAAVVGWLVFLYVLRRTGKAQKLEPEAKEEKGGLALMGPFLMWRTVHGRRLLDRLARRKRFWRWFGDASIVIVGASMALMTALLVWLAFLVVNIPRERAPTPEMLLGLPGLNPLIPLWYGILGLAVAIIIHEFCHGILARVSKIKVNFLGLLLFIVPVGAFVEPDEAEMKAMPRRERARLFAVGPAVNIMIAFFTALIFSSVFMAGVSPVASGIGVAAVVSGGPAEQHGWHAGTIVLEANGTRVTTFAGFTSVMANTTAGQNVSFTWVDKRMAATTTAMIQLGDAGNLTRDPSRAGKGALGITLFPVRLTTSYFHPIGGAGEFGGLVQSTLAYISLPFTGLQPMGGLAQEFFIVSGPLAALGEPAFWTLANIFYWVFWLNLMLGMTNALPAVPLDGGYIFRDGLHALVARVRKGMAVERRDRVVRNVSYAFALMILALIVWQFIGPRIL